MGRSIHFDAEQLGDAIKVVQRIIPQNNAAGGLARPFVDRHFRTHRGLKLSFQLADMGGSRLWDRTGRAWNLTGTELLWERVADRDLPVSASDIKALSGNMLVTYDDVAWGYSVTTGWRVAPPLPGGPVSLQSESWGNVKARHR